MKINISREEKRRLSSQSRQDKKRKARGHLTVIHLDENTDEAKEKPPSVSRFYLQRKNEEQQRLKNMLSVVQEEPVSSPIEIEVKKPYSQKAFDLGSEDIKKHHYSGLIGEFPHKILY